jgi:hypothetical protein
MDMYGLLYITMKLGQFAVRSRTSGLEEQKNGFHPERSGLIGLFELVVQVGPW